MTEQDYGKGGRIAEALAKAQGEINNPRKGSQNPYFKSRYADLADGINAIREALSKHGIAYVQTTRIEGGTLILTSTLVHAISGESIEAEWPIGDHKSMTPQELGSALTYGRRYTLFPMVGIAGDDDDGNAANAASLARRSRTSPANVEAELQSASYQKWWRNWVANQTDPQSIREHLNNARQSGELLKVMTDRIAELEGQAK